jgi:hypothetical protein
MKGQKLTGAVFLLVLLFFVINSVRTETPFFASARQRAAQFLRSTIANPDLIVHWYNKSVLFAAFSGTPLPSQVHANPFC